MAYSGTFYRGVDYSPTWVSWSATANTQLQDSDFANDAFASLWANKYQASPQGPYPLYPSFTGDPSKPIDNTNTSGYRGDLDTIAAGGFNLVRLYNWDMARGTSNPGTSAPSNIGLDHLNFLNYAGNLGIKIVVPVSDFFLNDESSSWDGFTPASNYSFSSASPAIQTDFQQFVTSITDPTTGKIHSAIHSIDIGNEGDIGQGISYTNTTAANFLARTIWWIYNLHQVFSGIPITATFSNADQGGTTGTWFNNLLSGVTSTQQTPNGWPGGGTFGANVTGLASTDPGYASYYYNSVNISQVSAASPYSAKQLSQTLGLYDQQAAPWPYPTSTKYNVPLLLMEVFTSNRNTFKPTTDQAWAAVNQAAAIEAYLKANAGTTNLMGYNYFEFNDEPSQPKYTGLYETPSADPTTNLAQTGTTSLFYGGFGDLSFPVDSLTATPGSTSSGYNGTTLEAQWTNQFPATMQGTASADKLIGSEAADRLRGAAGNDSLDGGKGYDIALFDQNARAYTLKATAGSAAITVQDKIGTEGTDTLTAVEQVRFSDGRIDTGWIAKAASLPASQILKIVDLYTAGLNRAPDALGLDYYASRLADGASIGAISKAIFSSSEASPIYSSANSNPVFVTLAYQNALGRAPDAAGLAYWANELATGHLARTDFVTSLIAGARALGGSTADAQYIANKEAVGGHFALTQGLNNLAWAKTVEAAVNGTAASVTAANAQTDAFAATAATAAGSEFVVQIVGLVP